MRIHENGVYALMENKVYYRLRYMICLTLLLLFSLPKAAVAADLPRVVSTDYCADQFVLALAARSQILALSKYATASHSYYADRAQGIRQTYGSTEDLLGLQPDIVLRSWGAARRTALLNKVNIHVDVVDPGPDMQALLAEVKRVGDLLGQPAAAAKYQQTLAADWQTLGQTSRQPVRAAYLTASGFTAGAGTFVNTIIKQAGYQSWAEEYGVVGWAPLSLEQLTLDPPDLLIGSFFDLATVPTAYWGPQRHPELAQWISTRPSVLIPGRLVSCNGIFAVEAGGYLRQEAEKALTVRNRSVTEPQKKLLRGKIPQNPQNIQEGRTSS